MISEINDPATAVEAGVEEAAVATAAAAWEHRCVETASAAAGTEEVTVGGSSDMPPAHERAMAVAEHMPDAVASLVLEQGMERLRALQTAAHALDARITQVTVFLFAAAGVIGTAASNTQRVTAFAMACGAIVLIAGGLCAFRGIRSDAFHPPGLPPSWWYDGFDREGFDEKVARGWAAGYIDDAIADVTVENEARAKALNLSLVFGAIGSLIVALAVLLRALT